MTNPIYDYSHDPAAARDHRRRLRAERDLARRLDGDYLYGDLVCGKIFRMSPGRGGGWDVTEWATEWTARSR